MNREVAEILMRINQSVSGAAGLMTEVNAASSEDIASAGEELSAQAADLNQMVSMFVEPVTGCRPQADGRIVTKAPRVRSSVVATKARPAPASAPAPTGRSRAGSGAGTDVVIPLDAADEEIMI